MTQTTRLASTNDRHAKEILEDTIFWEMVQFKLNARKLNV